MLDFFSRVEGANLVSMKDLKSSAVPSEVPAEGPKYSAIPPRMLGFWVSGDASH